MVVVYFSFDPSPSSKNQCTFVQKIYQRIKSITVNNSREKCRIKLNTNFIYKMDAHDLPLVSSIIVTGRSNENNFLNQYMHLLCSLRLVPIILLMFSEQKIKTYMHKKGCIRHQWSCGLYCEKLILIGWLVIKWLSHFGVLYDTIDFHCFSCLMFLVGIVVLWIYQICSSGKKKAINDLHVIYDIMLHLLSFGINLELNTGGRVRYVMLLQALHGSHSVNLFFFPCILQSFGFLLLSLIFSPNNIYHPTFQIIQP